MTRLTPEEAAAVRMERELLLAELRRLDAMLASQPAPRDDDDAPETVRMLLPGAKPVPPKPLPPGLSLRAAAALADLIESDRVLREPAPELHSVTGDETGPMDEVRD